MRVVVSSLVVLCVLYFIVGGVATLLGFLEAQKYTLFAGIVGGLASVLGLIALARPSLQQADLEDLELQSLRKLAAASEEITQLERARLARKQEIDSLEARRREMEFLVQKASLSLFLQEQHRLYGVEGLAAGLEAVELERLPERGGRPGEGLGFAQEVFRVSRVRRADTKWIL